MVCMCLSINIFINNKILRIISKRIIFGLEIGIERFIFSHEKKTHASQAGFKLTMWRRITLNFGSSCLHLPIPYQGNSLLVCFEIRSQLWSLGCPGTHYGDPVVLELKSSICLCLWSAIMECTGNFLKPHQTYSFPSTDIVFLIYQYYTWSMTSISCSLFFISRANCSLIIVSIFCTAASRAA